MKRTTIWLPVVVAFVAGVLGGARLLPAEAQRGPAVTTPAACSETLAQRTQQLRAARRLATRAEAAAEVAMATSDQLDQELRQTKALLAETQKRLDKLVKYLGQPIDSDNF